MLIWRLRKYAGFPVNACVSEDFKENLIEALVMVRASTRYCSTGLLKSHHPRKALKRMDLETFKCNPKSIKQPIAIQGIAAGNNSPGNETIAVSAGGGKTESIQLVQCTASSIIKTASATEGVDRKVSVTFQSASSSGSTASQCYALPWKSGMAFLTRLDSACEYFFTPGLNGCAVLIDGEAASPTVIHANADSPRLSVEGSFEQVAEMQTAVYSQFYGSFAAALIDQNYISGNKLQILKPDDYLKTGVSSYAAVFGVKASASWTFYYNCQNSTKQLWPTFER